MFRKSGIPHQQVPGNSQLLAQIEADALRQAHKWRQSPDNGALRADRKLVTA